MTDAPLRVLMVEDSPTDQKLVVHALRQTGRTLEAERVETASEMRAALERATWDVIISDWSLPQFSALAALELAKRMDIDLPFIIVSGTIGEEIAIEAMRAGAHDYVLKDKLTRLAPAVEREVRESKIRHERREATKALLESEARYRRIVETTNEGIWMIDTEAKTTFMNERMARILGCAPHEAAGRSLAEFLDPEGRRGLAEYRARATAGVAHQIEVSFVRSDGTRVPCLLEASPVFDAAGRYEGSLAMVMDISERVRAQAAQRASDARFRRLWDSGMILISVSDVAGRIKEINDAGLRMLGYSREELTSGPIRWDDLTPAAWRAADEVAQAQLSACGVASPWEKELVQRDGRCVPVLTAAALLDGAEAIAIAIDLTDLKRTERDLEERMRVAALTADVAMMLAHEDVLERVLARCVESITAHLGVTFARVWTIDPASDTLVLQATAGVQAQIDIHQRVPIGRLRVGRVAQSKLPYLTNDIAADSQPGDPVFEGITAFAGQPLLVDDQLVGVVAVFSTRPLNDVALHGLRAVADTIAVGIQRTKMSRANAQLEAQLRQAQKMEAIGRLAGGIAHDFNNILSVIMACAEFLLNDLQSDDPARDDATEIQKAAVRAADLTRQLLMFSRQQVLEPRVLDLDKVLQKMERMLRRVLGEDVDVEIKRSDALGRVRVDPGSVEQVIMNLVVNARDAMPTGGSLGIETANVVLDEALLGAHPRAKPGPHVLVAVSDTGIGMDEATQQRVFEPFFTTKPVGKGTGLGLSTVFGIVEQSHGFVRVESTPSRGSTFFVYFPQVDEALDTSGTGPPLAMGRGSETILLVEDEEAVRMVAQGILKRHGYRVIEMRSPAEALLHCETSSQRIDLVLTDVVMPQMSGPELARRLVLARPTLKVLFMSGYTDDSIVRHGVLDEEIAFLHKPFTSETLTRRVREVLGSG